MNRTKLTTAGMLILAATMCMTPALAQDSKPSQKPAQKPAQPPAAAKPAEQPAAEPGDAAGENPMAMMMELAAPGPEHELMKQFEGKWRAQTKAWFQPGPPSESEGTMTNTFVLGGRFLRHEFKSTLMGEPFEGLGYWGYDKAQKQWIGSWMDTWGTGMMTSSKGVYDPAAQSWTSQGTYFNPETGKEETQREVVRIIDSDTHVMEMFMTGPNGEEMKTLEITYTRMGKGNAPGQQKKEEKSKDEKKPGGKPENPGRR